MLTIFDSLEKQRCAIFADLDALSETQLHFSSNPARWNLLQVVLHLMTSEKLSVIYIKRKTGSGKSIPASRLLSAFRLLALNIALKLPVKYKAPKMADTTGKEPDYEKLKSEWKEVRSVLKKLIETLDDETLKSELFKHPVAGEMNMKQALKFMEIHSAHHQKQIHNILNHSLFPS